MSKSNSVLFKKSLIAAAVLSLSACSSTPRIGDYDLSRVGEGIAKAGRTTADVSGRVWNKTTYLLGFSDDDGESVADEGLLMDAEDVALLDEESNTSRDTVVRPIVIRSAIPTGQDQQTPMNTEVNAAQVNTGQTDQIQTPIETGQVDTTVSATTALEQTPTDVQLNEVAVDQTVPSQDLIHEVAVSETLWDIAKKTTGDANNWHILADTNNLGPGASVFPGQELIIPADMVKPNYELQADVDENQQAAADLYVNTQNLTESSDQPAPEALTESADLLASQQINGKPFKVNPGETLWDFAKRITGDATNWKAIAGENNFSDKQASYVRTGQTIYVPESLVKPELDAAQSDPQIEPDNARLSVPVPEQKPTQATTQLAEQQSPEADEEELAITVITTASAAARKSNESTTTDNRLDILNESSNMLDETQPIKIVEATFKSSKSPAPALPEPVNESAAAIATDKNTQSPAQIMVSGTYYPKAVYNEADFSSSLLMRVSPGTTLQVSKAMGSWYQVKTDKGLGYVHQRDIK
ncbi:LysM peptidoglycan-binding domain-containing protein [Granulosicoccus sp. 3-233]|uniref:LysM peptidoglycan-binding domain-containing protein n=1 Tax=Granulosicoccus sp. 3-233 TaxID=3417969 RepID=UPI003D3398E4